MAFDFRNQKDRDKKKGKLNQGVPIGRQRRGANMLNQQIIVKEPGYGANRGECIAELFIAVPSRYAYGNEIKSGKSDFKIGIVVQNGYQNPKE